MVDGVASIFSVFYGMARSGMHTDDIGTNLFDGGAPFYSVYETADGKYVSLAPDRTALLRAAARAARYRRREICRTSTTSRSGRR